MLSGKVIRFLPMVCLVAALWCLRVLPAQGEAAPENRGSKEKSDLPLAIKGTNISIVPATGEPDQTAAENKEKTAVSGDQPRLVMDSTEFDAGEVWEGEDIIHPFTVKNTGKGLLEIKNVKAG